MVCNSQIPDSPKFYTPDASSFIKFIDNQVSLFTGSVDFTIPIIDINQGGINIPISLRYNTTGIKVMEEASWVGLGWNLNVGGVITHSINGTLDGPSEYNTFLNPEIIEKQDDEYVLVAEGTLTNPSNGSQDILATINAINSAYYGGLNPDIYYFSFLNYSGKFYVHPITKEIRLANEESRIKFTLYSDVPGATFWKAITPDGTTFFFTVKSFTERPGNIISSENFYLSKIITQEGEAIDFNYNTDESFSISFNNDHIRYGHIGIIETGPALIKNDYTTCTLSSISTPNITINFNSLTNDRMDLPSERKLTSVDVIDNLNDRTRTFKFYYDYFISSIAGNYCTSSFFNATKATHRLKLTEFKEEGLPGYHFNYIDGLPIKTTYAVDYWGYYNGEINNTRLFPKFKDLHPVDESFPSTGGGRRAANVDFATAGLLSTIIYPNGGERRIDYESNTFNNQFVILSKQQLDAFDVTGGSSFFLQDNNESTDIRFHQIDASKPTRIKIVGYITRGTGTYDDIKDAYIELRWYTTLIQRWDMVGLYDQTSLSFEFETTLEPNTNYPYSITVSIPDALGPQGWAGSKHISASATVYINDMELTDFTYSSGGGIRVARELLFDAGSTAPSLINRYDYGFGSIMTPIKFDQTYEGVGYPDPSNPLNCTPYTDIELSSVNYYPENVFGQGLVGYSYVDVHSEGQANWESGVDNYDVGKTSLEYIEQVNENSHMANYILGAPLWGQPLNGLLRTKIFYDSDNTINKEEIFSYSYTGEALFWGLHTINYNMGCDIGGGTRGPAITYPVRSYRVNLDKKIEILDGITTETNYKYNLMGQLIQDSVYSSAGTLYRTKYRYPYDLASTDAILMSMKNENVLDKLVSKETIYPDSRTILEKNTFGITRSIINPYCPAINIFSVITKEIYRNNSTNYDKRYLFTYNPKLVEEKETNNISTSYFWGYNQMLPVIKAENVDYVTLYSNVNSIQGNFQEFLSSSIGDLTTVAQRTAWKNFNTTLRSTLNGANLITTYTYLPMIGITSQTDPNGVTTYYEYDSLGRLKCIKDDDGRILKTYVYHYKE